MSAMKIHLREDGVRSSLEFDKDIVRVGRAVDNDIRLTNTLASRHHCEIERSEKGTHVRDLGSSNGTLVNGDRVELARLELGDVVSVGGIELEVARQNHMVVDVHTAIEGAQDHIESVNDKMKKTLQAVGARVRREGRLYELDVIDVACFALDGRFRSVRACFELEGMRPL